MKNIVHMMQRSDPRPHAQLIFKLFFPEVEEADQIYLLMKEEYRISRNVRLAWFLGKLNQVIWPASKTELVRKSYCLPLLEC